MRFREAIDEAWRKKINPGGEVRGYRLTEEQFRSEELELNRLYTRDEMMSKGYKSIKDDHND